MSRLGDLIKGKREALGLSQKRLGNICALSDSEIMRIENGTREKPSWENLCRIAQALDFSPLEILLSAGYITENDIHPAARIKGRGCSRGLGYGSNEQKRTSGGHVGSPF